MRAAARQRSVVQGVSLGITLLAVAAGLLLQLLVLAPAASGHDLESSPPGIVRGDGAAGRSAASPSGERAPGAQQPAYLGAAVPPRRVLNAGWSSPGTRSPEPGWTARRVNTAPAERAGAGFVAAALPHREASRARQAGSGSAAARSEEQWPRREGTPSAEVAGGRQAEAPLRTAAVPFSAIALPARADSAQDPAAGEDEEPDRFEAPLPVVPPGRRRAPAAGQPEDTPEPLDDGAQISLVGPASGRLDDVITYAVVVENARGVAHAPIRIAFDPRVLSFVEATEGDFLSSDGSLLQFLASETDTRGIVDIALSRTGSAAGISGSGTLCTVTFRAVGGGLSSIAMSGSRLLDASSRPIGFRRNDSHVAVD